MEKTKETSKREQSNRRQAISWWNNLTFGKQCFIRSKYHPQERSLDSLTGREIEEIWRKETKEGSDREIIEEVFPDLKSNQKQFVEFNEDLFKAYIAKFSYDDQSKMVEILLGLFPNGTFDRA